MSPQDLAIAADDQVGTWLVSWTHPKTKRFAWVAYQDVTLAVAEAQWRERHPDIMAYSIYGKVRTVER